MNILPRGSLSLSLSLSVILYWFIESNILPRDLSGHQEVIQKSESGVRKFGIVKNERVRVGLVCRQVDAVSLVTCDAG